MKAYVITAFGGPEVFEAREVPVPTPEPGQVLVQVFATSINPVDYKIRANGTWAGITPPTIIGYDVSGVIAALGPGVRDFAVGDEVYYTPEIFGRQGSYAEYHVEDAAVVARKPSNLSHVEAASIPLAGGTAWVALIDRMKIVPGETVLIHGSGGVGSLAVQIAKVAGAHVIVSASQQMHELLLSLGADHVVDYRTDNVIDVIKQFTDHAGIEAVFDTVGGPLLSQTIPLMKAHGRMSGVAGLSGDLNGMASKNLTYHAVFLERHRSQLDSLRLLLERKQIVPVIDSVLPLDQVAEAHSRLERGGVRGKIVLTTPIGTE